MFSPKLKVAHPDYVPDAEDLAPGEIIHEQGNPNLVGGGWAFPKDFGMSRADIYPDKRAGKWTRRVMNRWFV